MKFKFKNEFGDLASKSLSFMCPRSHFLVFFGNFLALAVALPNYSKLTHLLNIFLPLFLLSSFYLLPVFTFFMMIAAMLDNLSARMVEAKTRNSEAFIRQQMSLYAQLQRALNFPMMMLVSVG